VFGPFTLAFAQRGILEILLLAVASGLLGTWIVARGLAFYAHAVAAAAFPGLVLAAGVGFAPLLGALGAGALFAASVGQLSTRRTASHDALTALALVGALALGVILASNVFHSGADVDSLLFGSLFAIHAADLWLALAVAVAALAATAALGPRWLALGFDAPAARALGVRAGRVDLTLLALAALAAVASLAAVGSLLATALLVVPAVTTRLWTRRLRSWQLATVALAALEGVAGVWLSIEVNAPPGAAIATLAGAVFALAALARLRPRTAAATAATAAAAATLAGCGGATTAGPPPAPDAIRVVATTTQLGDLTRAVGGRSVAVHQILQPNSDPHEYEPRPADVEAVGGAKLIVESGDRLDAWMGEIVSAAGHHPPILQIAPAHTPERLPGEASGPEASRFDPHWWHDPRNAEAAVAAIAAALTRAEPAQAAAIAANAAAYTAKLRALDRGIAACFARVPRAQRKLVTSHDAFGAFAKRYGITVVGAVIPSQSAQAQPSAGQVAALARLIEREHVKAIYPETSINAKLAQAIAAQTGATVGAALYGDTLGPQGSPGATYLGMERANADAMLRGFTGGAQRCTIAGL